MAGSCTCTFLAQFGPNIVPNLRHSTHLCDPWTRAEWSKGEGRVVFSGHSSWYPLCAIPCRGAVRADTFFLLHPLKQLTSLQLRRSYQLTQEECEEQRSLLQSALQFCAPLTIA